tara:strand:- start:833 stop:1051 length:219 start_codon:yes stop_codon:yes gene_type:complete
MDGKMGAEFVRLTTAKNTARLQAALYGNGVEVVVQSGRNRWSYVAEGNEVTEERTTGWDERFVIPADEEVAV